jgi:hypothetical protein
MAHGAVGEIVKVSSTMEALGYASFLTWVNEFNRDRNLYGTINLNLLRYTLILNI